MPRFVTSSIVVSLILSVSPLAEAAPRAPRELVDEGVAEDPPPLAEAIAAYEAKKPQTASAELAILLREGSYPEHESKARYFLAASLADMGMWNAAQGQLVRVMKKGPEDAYFGLALERLATVAAETGDDSDLARIAAKIPAERVPARARSTMAYLRGVEKLEKGDLAGARTELDEVSEKSPLAERATYLQGVILQKQGRLKSAATAFQEVARIEPEGRTERELDANVRVRDLSVLNMGRIHYGIERFDAAKAWYAQVPRRSDYWPESLLEGAWASFMTNDVGDTLGDLLTLKAPSVVDAEFLPEAEILETLVWFNLCEYQEVDRRGLRFDERYRPMHVELKAFLKEYGTEDGRKRADQAFDRYFGPSPKETALPKALFARVLRDRELAGVVGHLRALDAEDALVRAQKPAWREAMGDVVSTDADRDRLKRRAGLAMLQGLAAEANSLGELLNQAEIIRFELVDTRWRRYSSIDHIGKTREPFEVPYAESSDKIYWPFNGEFWDDELGSYRYAAESQCW